MGVEGVKNKKSPTENKKLKQNWGCLVTPFPSSSVLGPPTVFRKTESKPISSPKEGVGFLSMARENKFEEMMISGFWDGS